MLTPFLCATNVKSQSERLSRSDSPVVFLEKNESESSRKKTQQVSLVAFNTFFAILFHVSVGVCFHLLRTVLSHTPTAKCQKKNSPPFGLLFVGLLLSFLLLHYLELADIAVLCQICLCESTSYFNFK
ncbi:transmembrane protein, putative [Bodo saltans]|uniref:Transmembrane protein, putative n=1 Tax=Bodo saltans TaxID=75058 RepID=A0A0S4IZA3_BODSA|nr:transmembrane protein, putative [Bodo saltans]|eukprot:CUG31067.1 transmembrane protein, putative [Bodo saltans]